MLVLLTLCALAAPLTDEDPARRKTSTALLHHARAAPGPVQAVVELAPDADVPRAHGRIAAIPHAHIQAASGRFVQVALPASALPTLAAAPQVLRVRRPYRPRAKQSWESEGVLSSGAQPWHGLGLRGEGQRVAIVDVGFDGIRQLYGGELPRRRHVDRYLSDGWQRDAHGTSVAEIVHDMAPEAELALYDFNTDVEFLEACDRLLANGERLVNASIGFDNLWHADGTSPWSRKVDELAAQGVTWVAAAGNEADIYWVGQVTDVDGDGWLEIAGTETLPIQGFDGEVEVRLRWDEPMGGASHDLDLYIGADPDADTYDCGASEDLQDGTQDPLEWVSCEPPDEADRTNVAIFDATSRAAAEGLTVYLYIAWGELNPALWTLERSLTLPADASGAISVGAHDVTTDDLAWYSSQGPTDDGRLKPDLVGPSHVVTKTDRPHRFTGTSAAAPHIAGIAALIQQASGGSASPAEVRAFLIANTVDRGVQGPDPAWGHGLIQLGDPPAGWEEHAVETRGGCGCAHGPTGPTGIVLFAVLGALVRRRSAASVTPRQRG